MALCSVLGISLLDDFLWFHPSESGREDITLLKEVTLLFLLFLIGKRKNYIKRKGEIQWTSFRYSRTVEVTQRRQRDRKGRSTKRPTCPHLHPVQQKIKIKQRTMHVLCTCVSPRPPIAKKKKRKIFNLYIEKSSSLKIALFVSSQTDQKGLIGIAIQILFASCPRKSPASREGSDLILMQMGSKGEEFNEWKKIK